MPSQRSIYIKGVNFFCDVILVNLSYLLTFYFLYRGAYIGANRVLEIPVMFNVIWVFSSFAMRLYWFTKRSTEEIFRRTWRSVLLHAILFMSFLFFSGRTIPDNFFICSFLVMTILFGISRFIFTYFYELNLV